VVKYVSVDPILLQGLLGKLAEWFAHNKRWIQRQTFALLCSQLVMKQILPEELFARDILPHLLDLSWDPVPNVRLSVARTLATNIMAQRECTLYVGPQCQPPLHAWHPVLHSAL
jgi:serine/threonine-protein phosphatase 4 regulatory subunit 1